ncbi:hypothetical protein AAC387_Pa07g0293 [Persea americana]
MMMLLLLAGGCFGFDKRTNWKKILMNMQVYIGRYGMYDMYALVRRRLCVFFSLGGPPSSLGPLLHLPRCGGVLPGSILPRSLSSYAFDRLSTQTRAIIIVLRGCCTIAITHRLFNAYAPLLCLWPVFRVGNILSSKPQLSAM